MTVIRWVSGSGEPGEEEDLLPHLDGRLPPWVVLPRLGERESLCDERLVHVGRLTACTAQRRLRPSLFFGPVADDQSADFSSPYAATGNTLP